MKKGEHYCYVAGHSSRTHHKSKTKDSQQDAALRHFYGISLEDYRAMQAAQDGRCAICEKQSKRLYVDHDHATGAVRALLCPGCNTWLAAIENDAFREKALAYLEVHART